jgi:hypothetical protein
MKCLMTATLGTGILIAGIALHASGESLPPGQVDFGSFSPSASGGEFVEVNVTSSLISLAAHFVEKAEPDVAKLLKGLELVHVNVIGVSDENRSELESKAKQIRKQLDGNGWERVVLAQQQDQNVGVYIKTQNKEVVQGVVVTVMDGNKQAVFVNVVGDIRPEQLSMLGDRLNIEPLKHLGLPAEKAKDKEEK